MKPIYEVYLPLGTTDEEAKNIKTDLLKRMSEDYCVVVWLNCVQELFTRIITPNEVS